MRITQTNGMDTATFDRPEPPIVAGGQGRTADSLTDTLKVCGWLMLQVAWVGSIVLAVGLVNIVSGHLPAAITLVAIGLAGCVGYGAGKVAGRAS